MTTRTDRTKQWVSRHREDIAAASFGGALIVGLTALVVWLSKEDAKYREVRALQESNYIQGINDWVEEERASGTQIYPVE